MSSSESSPSPNDRVPVEAPSWPLNQPSYVEIQPPNSENGYETVLRTRFHASTNDFRVLDVTVGAGAGIVDRRITSSPEVDLLLKTPKPDIRVFLFGKLDDTIWATTANDIKKIFTHYNVQPGIMVRLRAFKHSSGPESVRTYDMDAGKGDCDGTGKARSYDLMYNIVIPHSEYTTFIPTYYSYDFASSTQLIMFFHDSVVPAGAEEFENAFEKALASIVAYPQNEAFMRNPVRINQLVMDIVAEGWSPFARSVRGLVTEMEMVIQKDPYTNIWEYQKLFGHLTLRQVQLHAAEEILELLGKDNRYFCKDKPKDCVCDIVETSLDHVVRIAKSLRRDMDFTRGRLEDLSNLSINMTAQRNSLLTAEIAEQNVKDALSMRTIALVTLVFLPGAYVSGFFSMTFFSDSFSGTTAIYLYFVITLPLTLFTVALWAWWAKHEERKVEHARWAKEDARTKEVQKRAGTNSTSLRDAGGSSTSIQPYPKSSWKNVFSRRRKSSSPKGTKSALPSRPSMASAASASQDSDKFPNMAKFTAPVPAARPGMMLPPTPNPLALMTHNSHASWKQGFGVRGGSVSVERKESVSVAEMSVAPSILQRIHSAAPALGGGSSGDSSESEIAPMREKERLCSV